MSKSQRLTTAEARQASPSRMSLRVLVGSLALAILVGFLLYAAFGSEHQQSTVLSTKETENDRAHRVRLFHF